MWTCPNCQRLFKTTNQSHTCVDTTIDDLFADRPDHLVLAFDAILQHVMMWEPNSVGASRYAVVFANSKAWLIVKPMTKELDVKFYHDSPIDHHRIKKVVDYGGKYAHHLRVSEEHEVNGEFLKLLKMGYDYALE
ncbi:MAG: DUF5655 domain-containing protein [Bacteroidia bacterium]|nr:DUF5655 domain-containing protein [Bacteroidia bacterium]